MKKTVNSKEMIELTKEECIELRKTQLQIFDCFRKFCEENHLRYFLVGGSLLGAVRHEGYIPWDDDLDVGMPADDYYKFIRTFEDTELFYLDCQERDKRTWQHFGKLMMRDTLFGEYVKQNYDCNKGIFIDVFPLLSTPPKKSIKGRARDLWIRVLNYKCFPREFVTIWKPRHPIFSSLLKALSQVMFCWCSSSKAREIRNAYLEKHSRDKNDFVSLGDNLLSRVPCQYFDEIAVGTFEGRTVPIPKKWDEYLTWVYGDYMTLPPESERVPHHYVCGVKFNNAQLTASEGD